MSDALPTVAVQTENGVVLINKSDYDANPKGYKLATEKAIAEAAGTQASGENAPPVALPEMMVGKEGKKSVVVGADGVKLEGIDGIDAAGYADDGAAWAAIMAVKAAHAAA